MTLEHIAHKKNFSPNLGRALINKIPVHLYFKYIFGQKYEDYKGETFAYSRFLLHSIKCFKNYNKLYKILSELKDNMKYPQTYSFKIDPNNKFRLEIYFYYSFRKYHAFKKEDLIEEYVTFFKILSNNGYTKNLTCLIDGIPLEQSTIWSFDFYDTDEFFGDKVNFYFKSKELPNNILYWGTQFTKSINGIEKTGNFFCFNKKHQLNLIEDLNYNFSKLQLNAAQKVINKYNCKEYNISKKHEEDGSLIFFVQYFGISDDEFESFLINNNYPKLLIRDYSNNKQLYVDMLKEVTEVFKITSTGFELYRCALYGLI